MNEVGQSFQRFFALDVLANSARLVVSALEALLVIAVVLVIGHRLQTAWRNGRLSRTANVNLSILIGRLTLLTCVMVGVVWVAWIFGVEVSGLLTFLGVFTLAVAFAVQDVLKNLVAGLYLLWERPFVIGDAIQVKDVRGTVEDVQMRTTLLRGENGQTIVVPNAVLFTEIVINRRTETPPPESATAP